MQVTAERNEMKRKESLADARDAMFKNDNNKKSKNQSHAFHIMGKDRRQEGELNMKRKIREILEISVEVYPLIFQKQHSRADLFTLFCPLLFLSFIFFLNNGIITTTQLFLRYPPLFLLIS